MPTNMATPFHVASGLRQVIFEKTETAFASSVEFQPQAIANGAGKGDVKLEIVSVSRTHIPRRFGHLVSSFDIQDVPYPESS
jgi:hypothetical protein